jgi:TRAP-type C4-dicarboxylate transport system permease small subunit
MAGAARSQLPPQAAGPTALERLRAAYERVLEWLVAALMIVLAVEVILGVVFRSIGQALGWYDEVASVLLAWLTFYGAALASLKRAHISCPELVELAPPAVRRVLNIVAQVLVIAFFALLAWIGGSILPVLATDALVSLPQVPMSFVQSVIPISATLIVIAEVMHLVALVRAEPVPRATPGVAAADALH